MESEGSYWFRSAMKLKLIAPFGNGNQSVEPSQEVHMCPVCMAYTAAMVAGAGSTGGILAVCIGRFKKYWSATGLDLFQKAKEK
jgi:hypothetical protein